MQISILFLLVGLSLNFCGCSQEARKETWIKAIVRNGMKERASVLADAEFIDFKVYRDGNKDGVCYEYIVTFPELERDELKRNLISGVRSLCQENSQTKAAFQSGIFFRFLYKTQSEKVLADQTITAKDLGF